jgi:xylulose-5-phosphate/fructose-6-phosphate phosphoketolase
MAVADMDAAIRHCTAGVGIWDWASTDDGTDPDVVMACAGDVPTLETLAAVTCCVDYVPDPNPVGQRRRPDALQPAAEHPHGLSDREVRHALFTRDRPVIFAFPRLPVADPSPHLPAHNHANLQQGRRLHVRGYKEEGTDHHARSTW